MTCGPFTKIKTAKISYLEQIFFCDPVHNKKCLRKFSQNPDVVDFLEICTPKMTNYPVMCGVHVHVHVCGFVGYYVHTVVEFDLTHCCIISR